MVLFLFKTTCLVLITGYVIMSHRQHLSFVATWSSTGSELARAQITGGTNNRNPQLSMSMLSIYLHCRVFCYSFNKVTLILIKTQIWWNLHIQHKPVTCRNSTTSASSANFVGSVAVENWGFFGGPASGPRTGGGGKFFRSALGKARDLRKQQVATIFQPPCAYRLQQDSYQSTRWLHRCTSERWKTFFITNTLIHYYYIAT